MHPSQHDEMQRPAPDIAAEACSMPSLMHPPIAACEMHRVRMDFLLYLENAERFA